MSAMSSSTRLRVTATGFATHVVEVRNLSKLRKKHRGGDDYVGSETFTVDGVDWMVRVNPDGDGDEQGYLGVFVELVTEGVAVWAHVGIGLVDWTTGRADPLFPLPRDDEQDPVLFDAAGNGGDCCTWGTGKLASWRKDLRRSRYLRRDCLRIECVVDVCHFRLAFRDPPAPKFTPRGDKAAVATLGSEVGVDVDVDDMPRPAVEALLQFANDGTLPVVDGLGVDGYRDMFRHLLLAAKRYGMGRLSAICERVLCRCIDVETAAATLAMADWHGFDKLREACVEFVSDPENYVSVRTSEGYDAELVRPGGFFCVRRELWVKYCERSGAPCDKSHELDFLLDFDLTTAGDQVVV